MATEQKMKTWDVFMSHPLVRQLDEQTQLALLCEYIDLYDELRGMSLVDYVNASLLTAADQAAAAPESDSAPPPGEDVGDVAAAPEEEDDRPESMLGMRVVYRYPGRNVLSDLEGVTRDAGGTVAFTDVDGEHWPHVARDKVYPVDPANYEEIHVAPREAKEIEGWLAGNPAKGHREGELLKNIFVEFPEFPERIVFAVMNGKRPYVDRFVKLPDRGFEDDQKPTVKLFGEHCFRVRGKHYVVRVSTP